MTLTITTPLPGDQFGPGFKIIVSTDTVGPFDPTTSYWDIKLTDADGINIVVWRRQYAPSSSLNETFLQNYDGLRGVSNPPTQGTFEGDTVHLRVILVSSFTPIEDETISVVMNRQQGQVQELASIIASPSTSAPTLTEEEHNAILQTNVGVIAMAGIDPLTMIGDLAAALSSNPPLGFGSLSAAYTLTGDGEMPDIGDLLHTKLGIYFIATIPAGLSHRHGQSEEYPSRLIQWRTVHSVGGLEMVTEVVDFQTHGELWKWSTAKPSRIEYSVLPGVVVQAQWWQFP